MSSDPTDDSTTPPFGNRWADFLEGFDWQKFFEIIPIDEYERQIDDREKRLSMRKKELRKAHDEVKRLEGEIETYKTAFAVRRKLLEKKEMESEGPFPGGSERTPSIPPRKKRAAVLRAFEERPGKILSPGSVRRILGKEGLIDPENETGTPVRILLAQLTEANVLERPKPGRYRLKNRDERLALGLRSPPEDDA